MIAEVCRILPKPATRCPLGAPPPTPPAVRSQAEVAMALPSSLLSPAPLWAFLALYPEPAAGSGCASISSAHDPSAAIIVSFRPVGIPFRSRWGMRTLVRQEIAERHLFHLLLGCCRVRVSPCSCNRCSRECCAVFRPCSRCCYPQTPCHAKSRGICTYP